MKTYVPRSDNGGVDGITCQGEKLFALCSRKEKQLDVYSLETIDRTLLENTLTISYLLNC